MIPLGASIGLILATVGTVVSIGGFIWIWKSIPGSDNGSYDFIEPYPDSEGLTRVRKGKKWFHIRPDGSRAYRGSYDFVGVFSEKLVEVRKNGKAFHIRPDGSRAYPESYDAVRSFSEGLAWVRKAGKWFQIRLDGTCVPQ